MSCNREAAKQHDITVPSPQWRREIRKFWKCCSFPIFVLCKQNWTLLKKKIREYWNQTTWLNRIKSAATEEGESWESLWVLLRSSNLILFSSPENSALRQRRHLALGTDPLGWTLEWLAEHAWSSQGRRCCSPKVLSQPAAVSALSSNCIDKLWICRYSSFSTGWKTSADPYSN